MAYKDPARQRAYQRQYKRLERAGESRTPGQTLVPVEFRLKTAIDVLGLLEAQVEAVLLDRDVGTLERARCVGYLAGVSLKAIEAGEMAARVEAVEAALKLRPRQTNP
jgi:hypothetical protein